MIYIRHVDQSAENYITYTIAGQVICSDTELVPLSFQPSPSYTGDVPSTSFILTAERLIYDELAWIGRTWRQVRCWSAQKGYIVDVAKIACYDITYNTIVIRKRYVSPKSLLDETTLGPAFILCLAMRQTYCLHASAVSINNQAILFIGESGRGKSTFAAWLKIRKKLPFLSDDILPISFDDHLYAIPHYPQLKLGKKEQPTHRAPPQLPITAIIYIGEPNSIITAQRLPLVESTLCLLRHTVAVRLFDKQLLKKLLPTWAASSTQVPIYQLDYPRDFTRLEEVYTKVLTLL